MQLVGDPVPAEEKIRRLVILFYQLVRDAQQAPTGSVVVHKVSWDAVCIPFTEILGRMCMWGWLHTHQPPLLGRW